MCHLTFEFVGPIAATAMPPAELSEAASLRGLLAEPAETPPQRGGGRSGGGGGRGRGKKEPKASPGPSPAAAAAMAKAQEIAVAKEEFLAARQARKESAKAPGRPKTSPGPSPAAAAAMAAARKIAPSIPLAADAPPTPAAKAEVLGC